MSRIRRLLFTALLAGDGAHGCDDSQHDGKPQDKVNVCHRTGNGSFHEINISGNALPAHMRHGDVLPRRVRRLPVSGSSPLNRVAASPARPATFQPVPSCNTGGSMTAALVVPACRS